MTLDDFKQWKDDFMNRKEFFAAQEESLRLDKEMIQAPEPEDWYRVFDIDPTQIHTIITGDSIYPYNYCADGLAFSSLDDSTPAMNKLHAKIYKDLGYEYDYGDNCKEKWLERGCLCLPLQLTRTSGRRTLREFHWVNLMLEYLDLFLYDNQPRAFLLLDQFQEMLPIDESRIKETGSLVIIEHIDTLLAAPQNYFQQINAFIKRNYNLNMNWT